MISIYLNGTDNLTDGTLRTPGNGITLGAINEVVTVHLRSPAGYANAESVTIPAPIDCHVSADGETYGETATYGIGAIPDTNTPLHVKRVVNTVTPPGSDPYETGIAATPRVPDVEVTDVAAPVIAGTLTAVAGVGQVTLSGPTATDNVGIAKWQYRVDGGAWVDIESTSSTMPSTVVAGLTIGMEYDFDVRALDVAGNASGVLSATSAVVLAFFDDFATDGALDSALWATSVAGAGTVIKSGGELVIDTRSAITDAAFVTAKIPVPIDAPRTYRAKFKVMDAATGAFHIIAISQRDGGYPVVAASNASGDTRWSGMARYAQGAYISFTYTTIEGVPYAVASVYNSTYTAIQKWNISSLAWEPAASNAVGQAVAISTQYVAEMSTDSEGVVFRMYESDGVTVLFETSKLLWGEIAGYDYTKYFIAGEPFTNAISALVHYDYISVEG